MIPHSLNTIQMLELQLESARQLSQWYFPSFKVTFIILHLII